VASKFRLAAVLRVRRLIEGQKKQAFGAALGELSRCKADREDVTRSLGDQQDEYNRYAGVGVGIEQLRLRQAFLLKCRMDLRFAELAVAEAEDEANERRDALVEATRDREVVEKLEEKFIERATYERNKETEKQLAEIALGRFAMRARAVGSGGGDA
jgi:flagellar protein FliJ